MISLNDFQRNCYSVVALLFSNLEELEKYAKEEIRLVLVKRSQGLDPVWHIEGQKYPNWRAMCGREIARDNILSTRKLTVREYARAFIKQPSIFCQKCATLLFLEYVRSLWQLTREKDLTISGDGL